MNADIGYLHRERVRAYTHRSRHTYCQRQPAASQVTKQRRKRKMNGIFFIAVLVVETSNNNTNNNSKDQTSDNEEKKKQIYTEKTIIDLSKLTHLHTL